MIWRKCYGNRKPDLNAIIKVKIKDQVFFAKFKKFKPINLPEYDPIDSIFRLEELSFYKDPSHDSVTWIRMDWLDLKNYKATWRYIDKNELMAFL